MFMRIFRYSVRPELRDRHLAAQARAARLYEKYVRQPPRYFRGGGDPDRWVELHWYADRQDCLKVAEAIAADPELAGLWKEFQDTLDPGFPTTLEEFNEYELPVKVNTSPFAQPPIDEAPRREAPDREALGKGPAAAAVVPAEAVVAPPVPPAAGEASPPEPAPHQGAMWEMRDESSPREALPRDEISIVDEPPEAVVEKPLSYSDGVWEVPPRGS